jgi:conjugal transfer pilin signal peptidase TrbI
MKRFGFVIRLIVVLGVFAASLDLFGIRINSSDSLPHKLFWAYAKGEVKVGQIVSFKRFDTVVAKEIVGLPGDPIEVVDGVVWVGGREVGKALEVSPSGKNMTLLTRREVPEGKVFCRGTHPESFDSRYAEFGLVGEDEIVEWLKVIL